MCTGYITTAEACQSESSDQEQYISPASYKSIRVVCTLQLIFQASIVHFARFLRVRRTFTFCERNYPDDYCALRILNE